MSFRQEDRKTSYKKGIDASEGRRTREETTIKLRKDKKDVALAKRRMMATPAVTNDTSTASPSTDSKVTYTVKDIPSLAAALLQPNIDSVKLLEIVRGFRKILSVENCPPVREVLDSGVLPAFVKMLSLNDQPEVQFEASWALTNIASSDFTKVVVEAGAIPIFVQLLTNSSAEIREQSAWALGNIAGDCSALRDMVLNAGAMQPLLQNIAQPANASLLNNCVWSLSNLCRGKPSPDLDMVAPAIPALANVLKTTDGDARVDALWALSYISDGEDERIQKVIECGIVPLVVELLSLDNTGVITPALRIVGNIVSGNDEQTQAVLDAGLLKKMPLFLENAKRSIKKEACWVLSNIAAGTHQQIKQVLKDGGMLKVANLAINAEWEVRKEAIWVLSNIATGGTETQVMSVVEAGAIDSLCSILNVNDTKMILVALDAIESILKVGAARGKDYVSFVDECDGLMFMEELQEHESEDVYEKAVSIIETYFGIDGDMEDENLAPAIDGNTFSFGVPQKDLDASFEAVAGQPMQFNFASM